MGYNITCGTGTIGLSGVAAPTPLFVGQSFTTVGGGTVTTIVTNLGTEGTSPTDNALLDVYAADGSGFPTGSSLGQATVAASTISHTNGNITFTFSPKITVAANTQYALVMSRSGAASGLNYFVWDGDNADTYAGGSKQTSNGTPTTGWSTQPQDCNVVITVDSGDNNLTLIGIGT